MERERLKKIFRNLRNIDVDKKKQTRQAEDVAVQNTPMRVSKTKNVSVERMDKVRLRLFPDEDELSLAKSGFSKDEQSSAPLLSFSAVASPTTNEARPALSTVASPTTKETHPALSTVASPTTKETHPALSTVASPTTKETHPALSTVASSTTKETHPALSTVASPTTKETHPALSTVASPTTKETHLALSTVASPTTNEARPALSTVASLTAEKVQSPLPSDAILTHDADSPPMLQSEGSSLACGIDNVPKSQESFICKIDLSKLISPSTITSDQAKEPADAIVDINLVPDLNTHEHYLQLQDTPTRNIHKSTGRSARKQYAISPINSDESDPDVSDTDPTYNKDGNNFDTSTNKRSVPRLLQSRQSRSMSSSSSSSSSGSSSSSSSSSSSQRGNNTLTKNSPERQSRKRKRDPKSWKMAVTKRKRNSGESYVSRTKKVVPARSLKPPCNEKCRIKCSQKIDETERLSLFKKYWNLKDINSQRLFIKNCMVEIKPKYKYTKSERPRQPNYSFYFKTKNNIKERVCKTFFLNTFDISDRVIRTVKEKSDENDFLAGDFRGKHNHHKKLHPDLISDIKNFIVSIPRVESHYTRASSTCEYIYPGRTLTEIYSDFVQKQKNDGRPWGKFDNFYRIFKDTGIKIHQPKKDLCDLCSSYKLTENEDMKEEYEKHLEEKELSRKEKKQDREAIDKNNITACYDLEAILQCPRGNASSFYYKSKMNCFNFTIAELAKTNLCEEESHKAYTDVFSYFWDETQGQKGSVEIGTCVYNFLMLVNERSTSESVKVTFYSDNCCGQNKNKFIASIYMYALTQFQNINTITHKYLIKGHTQNENDNAHSLIEKEVKKYLKADPIYTPVQYISLIKSAKKTGKKFLVHSLTFEDFLDIKTLQSQLGPNFSKDVNRNQVTWNDIKVLQIRKDQPFHLYYKTSYKDTEYREINIRAGVRKSLPIINDIALGQAYSKRFDLDANKKKDLKSLLAAKVIKPYFASFYNDIL